MFGDRVAEADDQRSGPGDQHVRAQAGGVLAHFALDTEHAAEQHRCGYAQQDRDILGEFHGQAPGVSRSVAWRSWDGGEGRSEEHTSELQSQSNLVCRLLLEKKKKIDSVLYNQ